MVHNINSRYSITFDDVLLSPDYSEIKPKDTNTSIKLSNLQLHIPNGSDLDIAALTNAKGNVLAMMPHPERAYYFTHEPNWQDKKNLSKYADGYKIFKNARKYFK